MPEIVDIYDARPERSCVGCGKRDKAPRDQVNLPDGNVAHYHWDCHVEIANCEVCKAALKALGTDHTRDGLKDQALHERLITELNKPEKQRAEVFTTDAVIPQELPNAKK